MTQMKQVHPQMLEQLRERAAQAVQLKAEVARLRKELERMRQSRDRSEQGKLDERAAHEATKARVAELEAKVSEWAGRAGWNAGGEELAKTALDQARGLLSELYKVTPMIPSASWGERYAAWLRAHPAPATAVTDSRAEQYGTPLSSGDVLHATATPAATRAESEDTCCVCGDPCTSSICLGCENSGAGT